VADADCLRMALATAQAQQVWHLAALMGTSCQVDYRMTLEPEQVRVVDPGHPIAEGLGRGFVLPDEEPCAEFFDVPAPDELVLLSSFAGGEAFRSGLCWRRRGRSVLLSARALAVLRLGRGGPARDAGVRAV
jgi:trehalose utilization protein